MKILIAGYPYIRENFLNTFREQLARGEVFFLLPKIWKAKGGKVIFHPPVRKGITTTPALFYHSRYPLIGGLLKGWMPFLPLTLWRLRGTIDLLYSPSEPTLLTTLYQGVWARIFGIKHVVFTWENVPYREKFSGLHLKMKEALLRMNCVLANGIVCGNRKAQEILRRYTDKPMAVIPLSGVDTDFFSPDKRDKALRNEYGLEGKFIFSFVGALGYRKGIHLILEAFHKIYADNKNIHLIIVGGGEYEQELRNQIKELELGSRVTMIPWADPPLVRKILSVTDAFLYPSIPYRGWEEQFGYSIAEAMAMAVPVISTYSGSIADLIEHQKSGILVGLNNAQELEKAMRTLANGLSIREQLALTARKEIVQRYSFHAVANQYHQFFTKHGPPT